MEEATVNPHSYCGRTHLPAAIRLRSCQAPVAHACNPSYSGDRDWEDPGSKPARQIAHKTLSQKKKKKNPSQKKRGLVQWLKV
jgi:hypothetical protein